MIAPIMIPASVMKRVSSLRMWPISWPITPWSSSRLRCISSPEVTATTDFSGVPTEKALGASVSMM